MGRLAGRSLGSLLSPARARVAKNVTPKGQAKPAPWKKWYSTARWRKLKAEIHARDAYVCQATVVALVGTHPAPNSPVLDHIKPHRGDASLFWDPNNLQTVSKAYHDSEKQRLEKVDPSSF